MLKAGYYKKFQKYEKALETLMYVYKEQRKIYNAQNKTGPRVESVVVEDNKQEQGQDSKS